MTHDIEICNENDPSDPDYGPPETWGLWADRDTIELGPAFTREESLFDEEPAPDPLPLEPPDEWALTGPEDLEELRRVERLDRYLIDPELAHWIAYGNCRD